MNQLGRNLWTPTKRMFTFLTLHHRTRLARVQSMIGLQLWSCSNSCSDEHHSHAWWRFAGSERRYIDFAWALLKFIVIDFAWALLKFITYAWPDTEYRDMNYSLCDVVVLCCYLFEISIYYCVIQDHYAPASSWRAGSIKTFPFIHQYLRFRFLLQINTTKQINLLM